KQMEKKIDVLQANFFTDEEIFINETCLLKISTPIMLENHNVSRIVRMFNARIVEVNPTYATIEKTGITSDILALFNELNAIEGCVLQFVRSGRIAVTKSKIEKLDNYLAEREKQRINK
ncbi:MAG: acetolactate synthase small subunit, partial [Prevotellaceae bacterium]|nr:acetolactate synthase small subunit [Candidatus Minthosoma caballi]